MAMKVCSLAVLTVNKWVRTWYPVGLDDHLKMGGVCVQRMRKVCNNAKVFLQYRELHKYVSEMVLLFLSSPDRVDLCRFNGSEYDR